MFLYILKPKDQPFHSTASFNVISIAGIHFALHLLLLGRASSGKLCGCQEQLFVNRVCMNFEYITKVVMCNATMQ